MAGHSHRQEKSPTGNRSYLLDVALVLEPHGREHTAASDVVRRRASQNLFRDGGAKARQRKADLGRRPNEGAADAPDRGLLVQLVLRERAARERTVRLLLRIEGF